MLGAMDPSKAGKALASFVSWGYLWQRGQNRQQSEREALCPLVSSIDDGSLWHRGEQRQSLLWYRYSAWTAATTCTQLIT